MRARRRPDGRAGVSRLLGLDIGGTSSRARVSVHGDVIAEAEASSASLTAAGLDSAAAALDDLLAQLPIDPGQPFDAACAGSAGSNVPGPASSCATGWPR